MKVRVALAQLNPEQGVVQPNLERAEEYIARAGEAGADLVMFPELYLQGYRADELFAEVAVEVPGPVTDILRSWAARHRVHILMGLARAERGYPFVVYNSAVLVGPGGVLGVYDKIHLGTFQEFREGVYFAPGRRLPVFDTPFGRVGVQICYDMSFPEVSRVFAVRGAQLNLVLSAGPSRGREAWCEGIRFRSAENSFFTCYCNTVGRQKDFSFFGGSRIVGPDGQSIVEAAFDEEDFVVGDIDLERLYRQRFEILSFRERVPALYAALVHPQPDELAADPPLPRPSGPVRTRAEEVTSAGEGGSATA